jgi:hypothetical protein
MKKAQRSWGSHEARIIGGAAKRERSDPLARDADNQRYVRTAGSGAIWGFFC